MNDIDWHVKAMEKWREGKSYTDIAKEVKQSRDAVRGFIRQTSEYKAKQAEQCGVTKSSMSINADGTRGYERIIKLKDAETATPEDILTAHGLDPKMWILVSCKNNWWESQRKGGTTMPLYQSKITVKPVKDEITFAAVKDWFTGFEKTYKPKAPAIIKSTGKYMYEIAPVDTHLGKLAWGMETGENYDQKIAAERLLYVVDNALSEVANKDIEQIVYPCLGNDFYNSDNQNKTTASGTVQDTDIRWQKLFFKGLELQIEVIERMAAIAPVKALYIPGNHDMTTSYYLSVALHEHFRNYSNVEIDISPKMRKYIEYGVSLTGFTHGDSEKNRLHDVMPIEVPQAWGRTLYHEMHPGHLHKEWTKKKRVIDIDNEESGVIVRHLSSISATDAWHTQSGYVGAVKKAQNFLYDRDKGLVQIINSVV